MINWKLILQNGFLIIVMLMVIACGTDLRKGKNQSDAMAQSSRNIYQDEIMQTIYTLQNNRDSKELEKYFSNEFPEYRKAAILAFASVQDSTVIESLSGLFSDPVEEIRSAVAFALGQIGNSKSEKLLMDAYATEKSFEVKRQILEAIGKCGTEEGLLFLSGLKFDNSDLLLLTGQAWGLSRFSMRGVFSQQAAAKAFEILLNPDIHEKIKFATSFCFTRTNIDLNLLASQLVAAYNSEAYLYTKINLVAAFGYVNDPAIRNELKTILNQEADYRITLNAIKACNNFEYDIFSDQIIALTASTNPHIALAAAQYLLNKGAASHSDLYLTLSRKTKHWQTRTTLLAASLRFASDKRTITQSIKSGFEVAENMYEKAQLLKALAYNPSEYKFVENQTFYNTSNIVKTTGMETLVQMRKNISLTGFNKVSFDKSVVTLYDDFQLIVKKAIQSQDIALVTIAAQCLSDTDLNMQHVYDNTYFLTQALHNCSLPRDFEAYEALVKAINYVNGDQLKMPELEYAIKPDWELIASVSTDQKAVIKTSKGDIVLQFFVNEAPVTVTNFITLIKSNYFNGSNFHRVVPGFVIQDGCNRGDGWGNLDYAIRSEFSQHNYTEGAVGMASAGKDTESAQWFISHVPTAHLDGRYTLFATVIEGLEVVHNIELGDKIIAIELL